MKIFISVICTLLLLGCSNDSTPVTETPNTVPEAIATAVTTEAPLPTTNPSPVAEETASAPVLAVETPTPKAQVAANVDGGTLYGQKCASCHGTKGEKAALNKSQIIAELSEAQIKEALKGYQAGTYGKEMKALMQGQAKALDDAQIEALAKYISNL